MRGYNLEISFVLFYKIDRRYNVTGAIALAKKEEKKKKTIPCSRASIIALRSYSSLVPVLLMHLSMLSHWRGRNSKIKREKVSTAFFTDKP